MLNKGSMENINNLSVEVLFLMWGGIQICVTEASPGFTCLIINLGAQLRRAWNAGICFQLEFSLFSVSMSLLLFYLLVQFVH